ncbi:MAG: alpha/beta fold hydrolase [Tepidiformaceae bacterium]
MTVEATTISVRGGAFNPPVYRAGKGDPLIWLHGAGGMGRGWTPELAALAESYDVIVPVHPGWDDTAGLDQIDDIHDLVVYLQDLADALGLKSFNLGGHSVGGMFAAEFAAARPDMVKKLVLVCPVGFWIPETPVTDFFILMPQDLPNVLFGDMSNPVIGELFQPPKDEDEMAQMMYMQLANFSATGKFIWPIPDKGLKKRIHRISAPTLIIWGDQDKLTSPAYGDIFHSKIANSQLVTIKGAGHMVPLENTPAFAAEVKSFLG